MFQAALYGRIGKTPELRQTKNGNAMTTTSLAVDATPFNDETQRTLWIRVTAFKRLADLLAKHEKGDLISVSGTVTQNVWEDSNGLQHEQLQIVADSIISSRTARSGGRKKQADKPQSDYQQQMDGYSQLAGFDDNLPDF